MIDSPPPSHHSSAPIFPWPVFPGPSVTLRRAAGAAAMFYPRIGRISTAQTWLWLARIDVARILSNVDLWSGQGHELSCSYIAELLKSL